MVILRLISATGRRRNLSAMNLTLPHLRSQGDLFSDYHSLLWQTCHSPDVGYHSTSGGLSPASSTDFDCFSPPGLQWGAGPEASVCFCPASVTSYIIQEKKPSRTSEKSSRSRYPGKKRQSASEREKLRMRNLTKAVQHLRTYLPPSVAPAGQTLTKIETLRLTVRYISQLTEQLGLIEETPSHGSHFHMSSSLALHWDETQNLPHRQPVSLHWSLLQLSADLPGMFEDFTDEWNRLIMSPKYLLFHSLFISHIAHILICLKNISAAVLLNSCRNDELPVNFFVYFFLFYRIPMACSITWFPRRTRSQKNTTFHLEFFEQRNKEHILSEGYCT